MSRRPSVLENYRVPDLTNPINPLAAHEMVSRERMHGQELEQTKQILQQISRNYLPNVLIAASETRSELPLFKDRFVKEKTLIYVCKNKACLLPVESVEEAMKLIK